MEYFSTLVAHTMNDLSAHPAWALALVFAVSLGEALLIIGLFVPSTVVLVTAGTLVGAGKLPFWPVLGATVFGCILGDQLSFWAGRWYGDRLKTMWPLSRFPTLLEKGEDYVREHGGKSIAIGRFIPGIKAVVPGVAGMFGMNQTFFVVVNFISGTAWGAAHILPGILLGQALAFAGDLSGRLLTALLVLLTLLAVGGWVVRLLAGIADPHRAAIQNWLSGHARSSRFVAVRRFGEVLAPENPNSIFIVLGILAGILAIVALIDLVSGLIIHQAVGNFDQSLFNFFSELRSVPGDELFTRLSMLGHQRVLYVAAAVPVIWLAVVGKWRGSWIIIAAILIAKAVLVFASMAMPNVAGAAHSTDFRFPSHDVLMSGTVFGILAICCARGLRRWSQALVISCFAMLILTVAFAKLYLGLNWFSDVVGALLFASIIVVMFAVAISTVRFTKVRPYYLLPAVVLAFLLAALIHINHNFERRADYKQQNRFVPYSITDYLDHGWNKQPTRRINMLGRITDDFVLQWVGPLPAFEDTLTREHYKVWGRWDWHDVVGYLNEHAKIDEIAPRPLVHAGLRAKLTATISIPSAPDQRFVLRAFQSNAIITADGPLTPVYLIHIRQEAAHNNMGIYTLPLDHPATVDDAANLLSTMQAEPTVETLATPEKDGLRIVILKPKS